MPIVSIIVPVYNVSAYLPDCLNSIQQQTVQDWEAILVDDGSTDSSGSICDQYAANDSRFRVIHQTNAGAANAKNTGLDKVTGQFTAFVDSDDTVSPKWLETCLNVLKTADVVEYGFDRHLVSGYDSIPALAPEEFSAEGYLNQYLNHWQCCLFWNKVFRSNILKDIRFRKERRCIDDEFFTYKAVTFARNIIRITDVLYHYRKRVSSVTHAQSMLYQKTVDSIDILSERYQWINNYYPKIAADYLRHDVNMLLYFSASFPFNEAAISRFYETAKFYFRECLRHYPDKLTCYYSLRTLFFKKKNFQRELPVQSSDSNTDDCFI